MKMQAYNHSASARGVSLQLAAGHALRLGRGGGELVVLEGRVWLTRGSGAADTGDLRLQDGQRLQVMAGEDVVIEPWDAGVPVRLWWQPLPQGVSAAVHALGLRAIAYLAAEAAAVLRGLAGGLASLARGAADGARRAQGGFGLGDPA